MAKSVGERTKQEANAKKARFLDRNLHAETQGAGVDIDMTTGKPLKMGATRRNKRVDKKAHQEERIDAMQDTQNQPKSSWSHVESMSIIGLLVEDESDIDDLMDRLAALREQIPDLFDIHDESLFDKLVNVAVPEKYVDVFKAMFEEQQAKYKMTFKSE